VRRTNPCGDTGGGRLHWKGLEPHGWLQGATNLQSSSRSKPPKSGGTTWAEGVLCLAAQGRRNSLSGGDWDRTRDVYVSGGAIFGKPQERKFGQTVERSSCRKTDRVSGGLKGPHKPSRVSEDGVKERGSRMVSNHQRCLEPGKASKVRRTAPKIKEACRKRQWTCTWERS
jgi:hypothetical protein